MIPCGLTTYVSAEHSEAETVTNLYRLLARILLRVFRLKSCKAFDKILRGLRYYDDANVGDGISLNNIPQRLG